MAVLPVCALHNPAIRPYIGLHRSGLARRAMRRKAMKVILQDYEPRQPLFRENEAPKPVVRKTRLRLNPVQAEARLFHAL
jgi:hypothetical protein